MIQELKKQLEILDENYKKFRPDAYEALYPPITDSEIEALEQKFEITLPDDLKELYKWKNGINGGVEPENTVLADGHTFYDLELMLEQWVQNKEMYGDEEQEGFWDAGWLPVFDSGRSLNYDLTGTFTGNKGQLIKFEYDDDERHIVAPSLLEYIKQINTYYELHGCVREDYFEGNIEGYPITEYGVG